MIKRRSEAVVAPAGMGSASDGGWEDAPTEFTRRVVFMEVYGDTGTGRTRLALTAPGPIALAHTAEKIDGVVQKFSRDKVIRLCNFGGTFIGSPQDIANQAGPVWNRMSGLWYDAMANWARSCIIDTHTEGWEILRLARFGELNPKGRIDNLYGPVNAEWRSLFKAHRAQDRCNIVAIGQAKDEYKDVIRNGKPTSERTGRTIRAGQKEMPYLAEVVVRTSRKLDGGFQAVLEKGWWNAHSEGITFEDDDITFANIMSMVTETDSSEWE